MNTGVANDTINIKSVLFFPITIIVTVAIKATNKNGRSVTEAMQNKNHFTLIIPVAFFEKRMMVAGPNIKNKFTKRINIQYIALLI